MSAAAGPSGTSSSTSTPPMTPVSPSAVRARRLEDYEMDDSPRHSRESSRSLLSGHERSASLDAIAASGKPYPSSLRPINENSVLSEEEEEQEDAAKLIDDGKDRKNKHAYYDDTSDELPSISRRDSKFGIAASKAKAKFHDNRGLLMIIVSQACFAGMNVMVRLAFLIAATSTKLTSML